MQQTRDGHYRGGEVEITSSSTTTSSTRRQPLPMPMPRTPPRHPGIHGKCRRQAELNQLDQEISWLEEELKALEGLPPASKCCKEIEEFVHAHPDPLLPLDGEIQSTKGQSTLSCCCCLKRPAQLDTCCSCNFFRSWKCSCRKLSCKSCSKIPSLTCGKFSCMGCSCFRCVKCCHPCRRK